MQRPQQNPAGAGQFKVVMPAFQQILAELFFELAHLAADGTLRDVEQLRRPSKTAGTAGHFEGFKRIERGHFAFHEQDSRCG